jgi:hypothetical protein
VTEQILYLHNDPTPPFGDTFCQHDLPMDGVLPALPVLYNYDVNRDAFPGLWIQKGGSSPDEPDDTKHQHWFTPPFPEGAVIQGDATVKLWSAMKDFGVGLGGVVTVYLRDCDGSDCVEVGSDTLADANWQGGSQSWMLKSFSVPIGIYTLAPGRSLELVVVVDASSGDDMWFAYDTGPYRSRVTMSASLSSVAGSGASLPGFVRRWLTGSWTGRLFA